MNNIFNYKLSDLEDYFVALGEKKFKARQIYDWLYKKQVYDFKDMTNIKKDLIDKLAEDFNTDMIKIVKKQEDKTASKYLFKLFDDSYIEAVLMYHDYGISVCVSSQVGCNMGCKFCESGRLKKVRKQRMSSVVIMGIGEPFDNYNNVLNFIKIINSDLGIAIGARHITVSTCGLIPKIKEFSNENIQVNLAVSLHAPNNVLRNKIMPINKAYPLKDLIVTLKEYIKKTNRRVTIEYVILDKVNDSRESALELANLLKGMNVYVNLIPYNETNNLDFKKSDRSNILRYFKETKD